MSTLADMQLLECIRSRYDCYLTVVNEGNQSIVSFDAWVPRGSNCWILRFDMTLYTRPYSKEMKVLQAFCRSLNRLKSFENH